MGSILKKKNTDDKNNSQGNGNSKQRHKLMVMYSIKVLWIFLCQYTVMQHRMEKLMQME